MTIITLTSDFGLSDPYVGIMKGVLLSRAPEAKLVDLSHQLPPQDINAAGHTLQAALPFFPAATIHVAVVDPGVGSSRQIICLACHDQLLLAPDNGLLSPFLSQADWCRQVSNKNLFLSPLSATFHGRDIFAPVAAALATGLDPAQLGVRLELDSLQQHRPAEPLLSPGEILGEISHIDHFGNCLTTITTSHLPEQSKHHRLTVHLAGLTISGLVHSYSQGIPDQALALISSTNQLEIALPNDSAAKKLQLFVGQPIKILLPLD